MPKRLITRLFAPRALVRIRGVWCSRPVEIEGKSEPASIRNKPEGAMPPTPAGTPQRADIDLMGNIFIGIAGMIGAGKSTLATALGEHLGIDAYYEPVKDNEYLEDFYRDTKSYSFAMQVYLLNRRFQQHQEIIWKGQSAVQDRTIYED